MMSSSSPVLESISGRRLLVVTGKGGVGKSAVTAALGRVLAAAGRSVLVIEADPRETLHELYGTAPSDGEIVAVAPRLSALNIDPRRVIEQLVKEHLKVGMIARRILGSPVFDHFSAGAPGMKELAVLEYAKRQSDEKAPRGATRFDVVLLDAPATGHGLSLLTAPRVVSEVIVSGPFGEVAADLAQWIASPGVTGVIVITRPEEMPVQEALELRSGMRERVGLDPLLLVVNGLYPPYPDAKEPEDAAPMALDLWRRRRALHDEQLARLDEEWSGPRVTLPYLARPRGPALVDALAAGLSGEVVPR